MHWRRWASSTNLRLVPEYKTALHLAANDFPAGLEEGPLCLDVVAQFSPSGSRCISTPGQDGDEGVWSVGTPWCEAELMDAATRVGHPFDGSPDLPDDVTRTIFVIW